MPEKTIITVGDVSCDHTLEIDEEEAVLACSKDGCAVSFKYGEKIPVQKIYQGFGGGALNCAIAFSRLGVETAIATIVGSGREGQDIIDFLASHKVKTTQVFKEEKSNQSTIVLYKNERTIFSYHVPSRGYDKIALPQVDWLYLGSAGQGSESLVSKIASSAEKYRTKIAFNPGSWQLRNFDHFQPFVKHCEIFVLNRSEADEVVGDGLEVKEQLQKMIGWGAKNAVITDGANGAYFCAGGQAYHLSALPAHVTDPTGAGDSFSAAITAGLMQGESLEESAKWGMVNAASVIEAVGANSGLLTRSEIAKTKAGARTLKTTKL